MYKLYQPFQHWYHGGTIYFYSDPHFSDEEMVHLRSNYVGDEEQIKLINSKVGKNDTIVFLGDIGSEQCIKKIRGYKVLITGNHDKGVSNYKKELKDGLFDEVYEGALLISDNIILSHEPVNFPYALNIHGHDHAKWFLPDDLHFNVCAELINYTPVSIEEIVKTGLLKKVPNIHREVIRRTIDKKSYEEKVKDYEKNLPKNRLNIFKYGYVYNWLRPAGFFANIRQFFRNIKGAYQRAIRGFSDQDCWALDDYYRTLFVEAFRYHNIYRMTCPFKLTEDQWNNLINKIIVLFEESDWRRCEEENPYKEETDKIIERQLKDKDYFDSSLSPEEKEAWDNYLKETKKIAKKVMQARRDAAEAFGEYFRFS